MLKKQKGGASVFILSTYFLFFLLVLCFFSFHSKHMNSVRDNFDTGLLLSLLGTATINTEEYGLSGNRVIHETHTGDGDLLTAPENASCDDVYLNKAINIFTSLLQSNLSLTEEMTSGNSLIRSPVLIEEFKIYNVYEEEEESRIYEFTWQGGFWHCTSHDIGEEISMPNGARKTVTDTTLYAKIGFEIAVFPYFGNYQENIQEDAKTVRVHMARTVTIPEN